MYTPLPRRDSTQPSRSSFEYAALTVFAWISEAARQVARAWEALAGAEVAAQNREQQSRNELLANGRLPVRAIQSRIART